MREGAVDVGKGLMLIPSDRGELNQTWNQSQRLLAGAVDHSLWLCFAARGPETPDAEHGDSSKECADASFSLVANRLLFKVCHLHSTLTGICTCVSQHGL